LLWDELNVLKRKLNVKIKNTIKKTTDDYQLQAYFSEISGCGLQEELNIFTYVNRRVESEYVWSSKKELFSGLLMEDHSSKKRPPPLFLPL